VTNRTFEYIELERHEDGILLVRLNSRTPRNEINLRMHREMADLWSVIEADKESKVVVITGSGEFFAGGGDVKIVKDMIEDRSVLQDVMHENTEIFYKMISCEKPIVSAINGDVIGAGVPIALLADVSIIAADASISDGHARLGVPAGNHAAALWPQLCGLAKAKFYLMTADNISGPEAERIGLVTFCVSRSEVMDKAMWVARKLARGSQNSIRANKKSLNNWLRLAGPHFDYSVALEMIAFQGADAREGYEARLAGRAADFPSARMQASSPKVSGAGTA
jgi:enoyl-CoA hydratase